ncbi:MAG: ROK family protein [Phycisphaerales bacterium]|nr:ROK family protein [Phycisphaerales bacterium]
MKKLVTAAYRGEDTVKQVPYGTIKTTDGSVPPGGADAAEINRLNKVQVLNLVWRRQPISRAQIARDSGLSPATVTRVAQSLIHREKLLMDVGKVRSSGGRPPIHVAISENQSLVIGLDVGATQIRGTLVNLRAESQAELAEPTPTNREFLDVMAVVARMIQSLQSHPAAAGRKIHGVGIALAGLVNHQKRLVEFSPDFRWNDADVFAALSPRIKLPISCDNVTRVMAMGELRYGIGRHVENFVCMNLGYGIGAATVDHGRPIYGSRGLAGELGHLCVDTTGRRQCKCGNYGCLEAVASGYAVASDGAALVAKAGRGVLWELCQGKPDRVTAELVAAAAQGGDVGAAEIFNRAAGYIGLGVATMINILNPEAVIIGGGMAQAGSQMYSIIEDSVRKHALERSARGVRIMPAAFGMRATLMGAVALVLDELLNLKGPIGSALL